MIVRHRQQVGFARSQPVLCCGALALRAVPVATGVVGNRRIGAVLASRDMAAEGCRAAVLDCRHHLELIEADMAGMGFARHAGPWPRKTSATSSAGRGTRAAL